MAAPATRPGKKERRAYYRQLKESFTQAQYQNWNLALAPQLRQAAASLPKGALVAAYMARPKEADLRALFALPLKFCFPKVLSLDGAMEFRLVEKAEPRAFVEGAYGILEPRPSAPVVGRAEVQACFVPLLAFDGAGRRLGHGKGFYDRFLEGFEGLKIGVGFEWQFSPEPLPVERFDQTLDLVVSEHGIRTF